MMIKILAVLTLFVVTSCGSIREMTNALMSMKDMQFRINRVTGMKISGIDVSQLSAITDVSPTEAVRLLEAYHAKNIKATFVVEVEAKNPNDGSAANTKPLDLTLKELPWTLYFDDREVVSGTVKKDIPLTGGSSSQPIPIEIAMNVSKVISEKGYDEIMQSLLALGGANGSPAKLTIKARPTVSSPYGIIKSPSDITIVSTEFRSR
jgi:hypothetical protein